MCLNYQIIKMLESCFQNKNSFLDHVNFSSDPSQILAIQYPIPRACLPSNFNLANWSCSSIQSPTCSSSVSLFCRTPCKHTPQLLNIPNHVPSQANQFFYQAICKSKYLLIKHNTYQKSWVSESRFPFKVRQHNQQQLCLQYNVYWILYKY